VLTIKITENSTVDNKANFQWRRGQFRGPR
jgi:hypothetical protein